MTRVESTSRVVGYMVDGLLAVVLFAAAWIYALLALEAVQGLARMLPVR